MKKIASIFLFALFVISIVPLVSAEEVSDAELTEEIEIMTLEERAEYRFEQLKISLENQIDNANDILLELEVSDEVMSELGGYIIELELLLERAEAIELTNTPAELAAEFKAIKGEAITITQNFKKTLNSELRADKISEIKAKRAELKELRKAEAKLKIEEKKSENSIKRSLNLLNALEIADEGILAKVQSGEMSSKEAKALIKEKINSLSDEEAQELKTMLKESREQAEANKVEKKAEAKAKLEEKKSQIEANREAKKESRRLAFEKKMEEKKANKDTRKVALQERIAAIKSNRGIE